MTATLSFRPMRADAGDLDLFRACFARSSDRPRSLEALRWQYVDNHTEKLFVDLAVDEEGGRLAAIYATLPGFMRIRGERRLVLQSLDTLTDADFRGQGLFVELARKTFARAQTDGAALVYGFPNGNSAHGFFRKLGWSKLDPLPFLLRPLRTKYFAEKVPRRFASLARHVPDLPLSFRRPGPPRGHQLVTLDVFDERVGPLWEDFAADIGVAIDRDVDYLRWRLEDKPGERYVTLALERGGELTAMCTFAVKDKHGGRVGYVMELLHRRGASAVAARLLAIAVGRMADDGADAVLAWCFDHSPNRAAYRRNGFFALPEKLRPIELHVGARAFDERLAGVVGDRSQWYLSYLDSDTV